MSDHPAPRQNGLSRREITSAITGGIAGAFFSTLFSAAYQWVNNLLTSPRLLATFGNDVAGCIDEWDHVDEGNNIWSPGRTQWARLRIDNKGYTTARNVCVTIVRLQQKTLRSLPFDFIDQYITCPWINSNGKIAHDVQVELSNFVDIAFIQIRTTPKVGESNPFFGFMGQGAPSQFPSSTRDIIITVNITADNATPQHSVFRLAYDDQKNSLIFLQP